MWEWTETAIGSTRGLLGGSFESYYHPLPAAYGHYGYAPDDGSSIADLGFRVAQIPEPTTLSLLALGTLALLRRRR